MLMVIPQLQPCKCRQTNIKNMQNYNKKNLYFLLCVFACLLAVFFTVVLLTYAKGGLWAAIVPVAMEGYGIYHIVKHAIKFKKEKAKTPQKDIKKMEE